MAQSFFNLNDFKNNEYLKHLYNPENRYQAAELYKENQLLEQAQEAIQSPTFGEITLGQKLAEMGIGEMVIGQIKETATRMVSGIADPIFDYLKNIEIVLNPEEYDAQFQPMAKQIFQASQAMAEEAKDRLDGQHLAIMM